MKKLVFVILLGIWALNVDAQEPLFSQERKNSLVQVHNCILAKANGKPISVMDVTKKLDMLFFREFPQYISVPQARFQFYETNWREILHQIIEKELILADAEENKVNVTNGEIRQEIETTFGPNVIANLDKVGLSYKEAWDMMREEIIIRRMLFIRVNAKVLGKVTPLEIKNAYQDYAEKNKQPSEWIYQVISFRGDDFEKIKAAAKSAYNLLHDEKISLQDLSKKLKEASLIDDEVSLQVSEEFRHKEDEISEKYIGILSKLDPESYSEPFTQKSRSDNNTRLARLIYLKAHNPETTPPFSEVEKKLEDDLFNKISNSEMKAYFANLESHFDVQETIPESFLPYALE